MEEIRIALGHSPFFGVALSLACYYMGIALKKKWKHPLCNPLLLAIVMVIGVLLFFDIPYESYQHSANNLRYLLPPATVCLAIPLYHQIAEFRKHWYEMFWGILAGVFVNLVLIYGLSSFFGLSHEMYVTLLPKSITSAIGLDVSATYGGITSITATATILTGILGNIMGESVVRRLKIRHPVAKGVALGTSSHAIGTTKAMELGELEGAMSSISIVITGILTILSAGFFAQFYHPTL